MTHQSKTAALIAYDAGVLSAAGRARVEKHLTGCDVCRNELAAARLWTRESGQIRALSERPPVDFARLELDIARAAKEHASVTRAEGAMRRLDIAIPACALAAAVLLTLGLDHVSGPIVRPAGPPLAVLATDVAPAMAERATVMLASGDARIVRGRVSRVAGGGEVVEVGESLELGTGELHVRFGEGTGVAVLGPAEVLLSRIDLETRELELMGGRIAVETSPPAHGSSIFVVLAASYRIEARVARFVVDLDEGSGRLSVVVAEGVVTLEAGDERIELQGPARWPGASGALDVVAEPADVEPVSDEVRVAGLAAGADAWPSLQIQHADIVRWELGELRATGGPSLSVRVPVGEHDLVGYDAGGASYRFHAVVGAGGLRAEGDALAPDAPRVREGYLPRAVLMSIVGESGSRLTHCYEQALRLRALSGDVTARVRLSPRGVVMGVRIMSEDAPASLERCVTAEAERWSFPPPGGPMSFDVPLRFRSR